MSFPRVVQVDKTASSGIVAPSQEASLSAPLLSDVQTNGTTYGTFQNEAISPQETDDTATASPSTAEGSQQKVFLTCFAL